MLIVGCGYIGQRVAQRLQRQQMPVSGAVRSDASADTLLAEGAAAIACDLDKQGLPLGVSADRDVLYCVPPPAQGRLDLRMRRFLDGLSQSGQPRRIVYLSTSGVYGDCQGAWVDESWPANPQVDRAQRRWDAEQRLQAWRTRTGGELVILRVAGIYGPGKLPLARLRRGEPMVAEHEAPWTNRIHADDLVSACLAAMQYGHDGQVYNACDGSPGNMTDYFNRVADMAGLPRPPAIGLAEARRRLSPGLLSYLGESRRLRNTRLLCDTGLRLRYPDLASGLASCFA
jgi:nucleoside-diphosphate-sugar epimerase